MQRIVKCQYSTSFLKKYYYSIKLAEDSWSEQNITIKEREKTTRSLILIFYDSKEGSDQNVCSEIVHLFQSAIWVTYIYRHHIIIDTYFPGFSINRYFGLYVFKLVIDYAGFEATLPRVKQAHLCNSLTIIHSSKKESYLFGQVRS